MPELDKGYTGAEPPQPEPRSMPFFPGPAGGPGGAPPPAPGTPLGAPTPVSVPQATPMPPGPGLPSGPPMPPVPAQGGRPSEGDHAGPPPERPAFEDDPPGGGTGVGGRITIEDAVIEKIAMLAALEARGVVALTGRDGRAAADAAGSAGTAGSAGGRGMGARAAAPREHLQPREHLHGGTGVRALLLENNEVSITVGVVVEYGSVIMEVAEAVRANVARMVGLMLGMRVTTVNVAVEDVRA